MAVRPLYLGPRLKRLRRELGLTQQAMADDLEISPSYIALLERNQRPLTADLLLRLARTYKIDVSEIAADDGEDYARRLADVLRDPVFADIDLPPLEIADLATSFPSVSEALLRLHGAYIREHQALADTRVGGDAAEALDPAAEAARFFAARRNHFPRIEAHAEAISAEIVQAGDAAEWLRTRGVRVRILPAEVLLGSIRRYDRHAEQLLISDRLDAEGRAFQQALHIAYTSLRTEIWEEIAAETFAGKTAAELVRRGLASYGAAALLMPYERFARAAETRRYDITALGRQFATSFEQVAHRLTTLGRAGQERVPFFLIRVDEAGNVAKRLDGTGLPFASHGGGCPLWNVHSAFRRPAEIATQWLELPGGQRLFSIARTVRRDGDRFGQPPLYQALALVCAAVHAGKLVYADGADATTAAPTPIGVTCRLCHRTACTARSAPPIGRTILPDDNRRVAEPFTFAED